jgi:RecA-family ATPase
VNGPDEELIGDPEAARRVGVAINAMRVAKDETGRLLAIHDCSRALIGEHVDAIDYLSTYAIEAYDLDPDLVQGAIAEGRRKRERDLASDASPAEKGAPAPLTTKAACDWEGKEPRELRWVVHQRLLRGTVGILSGDGAVGKTTVALQLAVGVCRKTDWLNAMVDEGGPVLFVSAEEEENEIHRRLAMIAEHHGIRLGDLADFHVHCRPGESALLCTVSKGSLSPTPLLAQITAAALERHCVLIVIEAVADVFGGDEINRGHVQQFMASMRKLALTTDAAVLLLQHPSLSGMSSGRHWNNAARSRLYLSSIKDDGRDAGVRELRVMKSNYGPADERVKIRWQRGVFVPTAAASPIDRAAAEVPIDDAFLRCLDAAAAQCRDVSHLPGRNYAPTIFEQMPEAKSLKRRALAEALNRLFSRGQIKVQTIGPASRQKSTIVRVTRED